MFRNILLVTWRHLLRHKAYTSINLLGLALGIAAFVLIGAYVQFERSYDQDQADADRIFRVESRFYKGEEMTDDWASSTNGYAPAMYEHLPGIASYVRINRNNSERVVRYKDIKYREEQVCFADSNFFSFFSYPLLQGDAATALQGVNSLAISASAARKYFGQDDPVGKILEVSTQTSSYPCMVTAVFQDFPANSTLQFNFLLSWATSGRWTRNYWYQHSSYTYLKLQPGASAAALESGFPTMAEQYKTEPALKDLRWGVHLVPLKDIHLNTAKKYEIETKGNRFFIGFLSVIAYVILFIAYINYINLATTKSLDRAREVGIRKVNGAPNSQLIIQFVLESVMLNVVALLLAIGIVLATTAWLPTLLGANAWNGLLFDRTVLWHTATVFIAATLVAGMYPALVMVKLKPMSVLKGRFSFSKRGVLLRKGMVAFQFVAAILLIAGTIAVYRQVHFMTREQTGVNLEQTIVVKAPVKTADYAQKVSSLKNSLRALPGVAAVSSSGSVPGRAVGKSLANRRFGASAADERTYEMLKVDHAFIGMYGLQVIAGRAFDLSRPADSTGLVLNESAVRQFGFASPQAAIGQRVWLETLTQTPNEVIGVVKDYHQQSLQQDYTPFILFMDRALNWIPAEYFSVKVHTTAMRGQVAALEHVWGQFFPESSFDYFFLDEFYGRQYEQELHFSRNFLVFSSLAIFITCLGLLGLTAYSTARRIREIGIRKVLGASVQNILLLLTWDVIRLILLCSVVALPVAWWLIRQWLDAYAFRAALTWWQFLAPVTMLVLIALLTTATLTVRAALANPTNSLRSE
ncbi:ABC transporter permease [Paraflavitalea pollutisoli]|uniref:ABC transporter permease n=1 Tax=Paraflavitalea pollutisoli TaxID=3034143 RepID=UPI0023ECD16F|nr:ABC transporter permease [Paraflavitalea sp. H1-2-19X]